MRQLHAKTMSVYAYSVFIGLFVCGTYVCVCVSYPLQFKVVRYNTQCIEHGSSRNFGLYEDV